MRLFLLVFAFASASLASAQDVSQPTDRSDPSDPDQAARLIFESHLNLGKARAPSPGPLRVVIVVGSSSDDVDESERHAYLTPIASPSAFGA